MQLSELIIRRKANANEYLELLKVNGKKYIDETFNDKHSFLKYPILVKKREVFIQKAEAAQIELGEWFCSPLHPVTETELHKWEMNVDLFPVSLNISRHIVNLPTETLDLGKVKSFILMNIDDIL